jgi:hypothetical protein
MLNEILAQLAKDGFCPLEADAGRLHGHGAAGFPFHTDFAFRAVPPRFIFLSNLSGPAGHRCAGRIVCEACDLVGGDLRLFDAHHLEPLATIIRESRLEDFDVLCPTCHRWAHYRAPDLLQPRPADTRNAAGQNQDHDRDAAATLLPSANRTPDNLSRFGGESHVSVPQRPFRYSASRPRRRMDRRKGCNETWNGHRWRRLGRSNRRFYRALAAAPARRSFGHRLRVHNSERRGRCCHFALACSFDPERLN